jgi:coniferyl-aldehyde dehydrogenase
VACDLSQKLFYPFSKGMTDTALEGVRAMLSFAETPPDLAQRLTQLAALAQAVRQNAEAITKAVDTDFGGRPAVETILAETGMVLENVRYTRRRLRRWMRSEPVWLAPEFWPSRARISRVPLGVVAIFSPWNYPVQLALVPLIAAIAGGNRVALKPSEHTPHTSALLSRIIRNSIGDRACVIQGGPDVAEALTKLAFNGIFFTGTAAAGRQVLRSAAENFVPVTLELGGKSPAIILEDADLARASEGIMAGKLFNAGQTCVAPDYVLVARSRMEALLEELKKATTRLCPNASSPHYAAILRPADRDRLQRLLTGTRAVPLMKDMPPPPRLGAWAVMDPPDSAPLMQEEVFGPILPLVPYDTLVEAIAFVNARPCPLAFYAFGDPARCASVAQEVRSGGVLINDTIVHVVAHSLPFGGAGASGMGCYHGEEGFRTFTRPRSMLVRSRFAPIGLARPPYGRITQRILRYMLR